MLEWPDRNIPVKNAAQTATDLYQGHFGPRESVACMLRNVVFIANARQSKLFGLQFRDS